MDEPIGDLSRSFARIRFPPSNSIGQAMAQLDPQNPGIDVNFPRRIQHSRSFAKSLTLTDAPSLPAEFRAHRTTSNSASFTTADFRKQSRQSVESKPATRRNSRQLAGDRKPSSTDTPLSNSVLISHSQNAPSIIATSEDEESDLQSDIHVLEEDLVPADMPAFKVDDGKLTTIPSDSRPVSTLGPLELKQDTDPDYFTYLLSRKFSSSNFIQKMDSRDVVFGMETKEAKMVGPYMMGELIGRGSYGKVKEGLCSETLQRVAFKIANHKRLRKIPNGLENVTREIKLLQKLKHQNCVRLLEVFAKAEDKWGRTELLPWTAALESQGYRIQKRYLIFEHCSNNLQAMLDSAPERKFPLSQSQRYFRQLIDGLIYLHSHHITHRDIKPGNILITFDEVLKISDYGAAESISPYDKRDICSSFAGTHQFLSPEVAGAASELLGSKVDVWAAGVTLYNIISGQYPFDLVDGNILGLYERIQRDDFPLPAEADECLSTLIKGMLEKDPEKRFTALDVAKHEYEAYFYSGIV
ncbi:kinase-like domain-containing protein [Paraphysoderma sedebokerense]|nr:kinase-like domain-containing protein [Paraphysoderma sedebokerense]